MSQALGKGVRALSWTRVPPPRARQGPAALQSRRLQIRAAPSGDPSTVNADHLPVASTSSSAASPGMSLARPVWGRSPRC